MKSALTYRTSLLLGCAALALMAAPGAQSQGSPEPSVEIHLDVLSNLSHAPASAPFVRPPAPPITAAQPAKKAPVRHARKEKAEHAVAHAKPAVKHEKSVAAHTKTKHGKSLADKSKTKNPKQEAMTATAPQMPPADKEVPAPANISGTREVPKLSPSELGASDSGKKSHKAGADSGIAGGFSDMLAGDSGKAPPPAPLVDLPPKKAEKAAAPDLPPAPPVKAEKDLPPAPPQLPDTHTAGDSSALPPLTPAIPETPKMPPKEMAQDTLTPLPVPPAPPPPPTPEKIAPAAPPAPVAAAPEGKTLPAPAASSPGGTADLRIPFNENETEVPLSSTAKLDTVAKTLHDNPNMRVSIMAYASGPETTGIYPKRVSLARGIAVRNYLTTTKGIDIERVNVKAMGNKSEGGGPGDRVDVFVIK